MISFYTRILNRLKSKGCEIVVFDKDNTLTAPYAKKYFDDSIKETISRVQQLYGYENVLMFSNSLGMSYKLL